MTQHTWYFALDKGLLSASPDAASAISKLDRIASYPTGWAHGDGDAFSADTVKVIKRILFTGLAAGLTRMNVFPRRDGGIVASFYLGDNVYDFTVFADSSLEWAHERQGQEIASQPIEAQKISETLTKIARTAWDSSGSYGLMTITNPSWVGSKAQHLLRQARMMQSQPSTWIAPKQHLDQLADI